MVVYPSNFKYANAFGEHFWVKLEGNNVVTIGLTDFFLVNEDSFSSFMYYVSAGDTVAKTDDFAMVSYDIDRSGTIHSLKTPLSGTILEVNPLFVDGSTTAYTYFPHEEGWMLKIQLTKPSELDAFVDAKTYLTGKLGYRNWVIE